MEEQQHHQLGPGTSSSSSATSSSPSQPPSSAPSQPHQLPATSSSSQQYGNPSAAAMLPPQRPSQAVPPHINSSLQARPPVSSPPISGPSMTATSAAPPQPLPTSNLQKGNPNRPINVAPQVEALVATLLSLNNVYIRELHKLQTEGAGNLTNAPEASPQSQNASTNQQSNADNTRDAQKSPTGASTTPTSTTPTPQTPKLTKPPPQAIYRNLLRRMQFNIGFLIAINQRKPMPRVATQPPPLSWFQPAPGESATEDAEAKGKETFEELRDGYSKLQELWDHYKPSQSPSQQSQTLQQRQAPPQAPPSSTANQIGQQVPGQLDNAPRPNQSTNTKTNS